MKLKTPVVTFKTGDRVRRDWTFDKWSGWRRLQVPVYGTVVAVDNYRERPHGHRGPLQWLTVQWDKNKHSVVIGSEDVVYVEST